jgi:hypothetical protein
VGLSGFQIEVTRTVSRPASRSRSSRAFASVGVFDLTASSAAPMSIVGPPAGAAGAAIRIAAAITARSRRFIRARVA